MDIYKQKSDINNKQWAQVGSKISMPQIGVLKGGCQQLIHRWSELLFDHKERQRVVLDKIQGSLEILKTRPVKEKIRNWLKRAKSQSLNNILKFKEIIFIACSSVEEPVPRYGKDRQTVYFWAR